MSADFSVLISVYHRESPAHLDLALLSIWDQQTLKPSQIVLVKDGPLGNELDLLISRWSERLGSLLSVVAIDSNSGLATALNTGLSYCKYDLVARMDSDDISFPDRFNIKISYMSAN